MRWRLGGAAATAVAAGLAALAVACTSARPTAMEAIVATAPRPTGAAGLPIPDPAALPPIQGQLLFVQAGEVVRWPAEGGPFQIVGRGATVRGLDGDDDGRVAAFVTQGPADATVTATLQVLDLRGPEAMSWGAFEVGSVGVRRGPAGELDVPLDVASGAPVVAWSDAASLFVLDALADADPRPRAVSECGVAPDGSGCYSVGLAGDGSQVEFRDDLGIWTASTAPPFANASGKMATPLPPATADLSAVTSRLPESLRGAQWDVQTVGGGLPAVLVETGLGAIDGPRIVLVADDGIWDLSGLLAGADQIRLLGDGSP